MDWPRGGQRTGQRARASGCNEHVSLDWTADWSAATRSATTGPTRRSRVGQGDGIRTGQKARAESGSKGLANGPGPTRQKQVSVSSSRGLASGPWPCAPQRLASRPGPGTDLRSPASTEESESQRIPEIAPRQRETARETVRHVTNGKYKTRQATSFAGLQRPIHGSLPHRFCYPPARPGDERLVLRPPPPRTRRLRRSRSRLGPGPLLHRLAAP